MFTNPQLHLYVLFLSASLYYLLPPSRPEYRRSLLIAVSSLLIFYAAPYSFITVVIVSLCTSFFATLIQKEIYTRTSITIGIIICLLPILSFEYINQNENIIAKLGVSYFALKSISILIDCSRKQLQVSFSQVLMLNAFFPIFSAGPIERASVFEVDRFQNIFNIRDIGIGISRILIGFFKSIFIVKELLGPLIKNYYGSLPVIMNTGDSMMLYGFVLSKFAMLYIAFSGYTDIAIGTGRVLGFKLRENFDKPFLATSIQNFWQRWHISLANTVSNYLFLPFVRMTGKPALAIFVAFILVGIWHEMTWNYLLWGFFHGIALAINYKYGKYAGKKPILKKFHRNFIVLNFFRILTISYVAWLSLFANSTDLKTAFQMSRMLIGI